MCFRRQQLLYQLNTSGKYVAFKEQLKYAVIKIVREKYLKTTNFHDTDELQVTTLVLTNLSLISFTTTTYIFSCCTPKIVTVTTFAFLGRLFD